MSKENYFLKTSVFVAFPYRALRPNLSMVYSPRLCYYSSYWLNKTSCQLQTQRTSLSKELQWFEFSYDLACQYFVTWRGERRYRVTGVVLCYVTVTGNWNKWKQSLILWRMWFDRKKVYLPFKDEARTALFKDLVRTVLYTLFISVIKTNQFML
jgi:hypothetical protein